MDTAVEAAEERPHFLISAPPRLATCGGEQEWGWEEVRTATYWVRSCSGTTTYCGLQGVQLCPAPAAVPKSPPTQPHPPELRTLGVNSSFSHC